MVFYSWHTVHRGAKGKARRIVRVIEHLVDLQNDPYLTCNKYEKWLTAHSWKGKSFLNNPELLLIRTNGLRPLYTAQYIGLASMRSYANYKITGDLTLDYLVCKGKEVMIEENPLLEVRDGVVHFKYETKE